MGRSLSSTPNWFIKNSVDTRSLSYFSLMMLLTNVSLEQVHQEAVVVVAQLADQSIRILEVHGSNPVIGKIS